MKLTVEVSLSQWSSGDLKLAGGSHDLDVDANTVAALACAEAAGSLHIVKADAQARKVIDKAVEADKDSLKALAAAVADGSWKVGNLQAFKASKENEAALFAEAAGEAPDEKTAADLSNVAERALMLAKEAEAELARLAREDK